MRDGVVRLVQEEGVSVRWHDTQTCWTTRKRRKIRLLDRSEVLGAKGKDLLIIFYFFSVLSIIPICTSTTLNERKILVLGDRSPLKELTIPYLSLNKFELNETSSSSTRLACLAR
jgi:hypothetical protein